MGPSSSAPGLRHHTLTSCLWPALQVGQQTIKLTLNKDARWTKALKFMLADLKWVLQWMVKYEAATEMPTLHNLGHEGPAAPGASGV